ncbi:MAG: ABC transporter ATP-binding protein [candidate division Zixibacteria bacterium]|jgi:phospholipid/cholesterol/gamma-HCH transport system ATP-binding protein|nr:ABC transporter ATP-binding protein [candidate division Zixibacteria bacterium]
MSTPAGHSLISIRGLCRRFGEQVVLDHLDLDIDAGESVVIIGQSGTGKSVLLKHIIRLLSPDSGQVLIDGQDITDLSFEELVPIRRKFGMLFQSAALFDSLTVAENVGLGLKEARHHHPGDIKRIVQEKLDMVGLASAADKYPSELSGGMRKRVGMARAIAADPEILLYDEPTTGLDPITADVINDLIVALNQRLHVTSIAVTHDMTSAFKIADRIVMLYQGRVEFTGTPDEVRSAANPVVQQFIHGRAAGPIQVR